MTRNQFVAFTLTALTVVAGLLCANAIGSLPYSHPAGYEQHQRP